MKRARVNKLTPPGLFSFEEEPKKVKRVRRSENDPFIERNKGLNPLNVLEQFLIERKAYVEKNYPKEHQIVLFEWELYYSVLQRIKKGVKENKLKN